MCRGKNTSVYVSGLPRDVTEIELAQKFGKLGALRRLKIYRMPSGEPKVRVSAKLGSCTHLHMQSKCARTPVIGV